MENNKKIVEQDIKEKIVKVDSQSKRDFLNFLEENKKDLNTGFGAFHTNGHSNW
jgi:hypothetical protein